MFRIGKFTEPEGRLVFSKDGVEGKWESSAVGMELLWDVTKMFWN